MPGLACCVGFSLVVVSGGFSLVATCRLLIMVVSPGEHRLNSCGTRAELLCGMWDIPGSGIEPVSHALTGAFFTTEPPGKPPSLTRDHSRGNTSSEKSSPFLQMR